jgi:hypothetical protein
MKPLHITLESAEGFHHVRIQIQSRQGYDHLTHFCDMLSTPTANPRLVSPARMLCAMLRTAMSPEEQSLLTVDIGTFVGIPDAIAAARDR